ncbi:NUDIX domain-containing protein [Egicoccus sp. AB-alg2]|uniref:NUDIX domain-containing protein n=1 Tax=Egicoccus sp. AB-alg2 TaxID=3242693 RepID=UPI00359D59BF
MPTATRTLPRSKSDVRRAAAAVCVRRRRGRVQVLLVSTRAGRVTLPKGRVEAHEDPAAAALREAREEAGVHGAVQAHVGSWRHGDARQHVDAFVVAVRRRGRPVPSERWRTVAWVDLEHAADRLARRCATRRDRDAVRRALTAAASRLG